MTTLTIQEKVCVECGKSKPLDEFHRMSQAKDGRQSRCKLCANKNTPAGYRNPERRHASLLLLRKAVHRGRIIKPGDCCAKCGRKVDDPAELHGHHTDYSKPLEVDWLCKDCHEGKHR